MTGYLIREFANSDQLWARQFVAELWGSEIVVLHGEIYYPHRMKGFVAERDDERVGLVAYYVNSGTCEIAALGTSSPGIGIGTALIEAVCATAQELGCKRVWVTTTNDNLEALRFYQLRGFHLLVVHRNAVTEARKIKPVIPEVGEHGIPVRDEVVLEKSL